MESGPPHGRLRKENVVGPLMGSSMYDLFTRTVERHGPRVATIEPSRDGAVATTYEELAAEVSAVRARIRAHGVRRGDRVAYWAENRRDFLVWQFACSAEGVVFVGANTRYRAVELAHLLEQARPALIVVPERLLEIPMRELLHQAVERASASPRWAPPQVAVLASGRGEAHDQIDAATLSGFDVGAGVWHAGEPAGPLDDDADRGRPDDLAMVFTTSGSTGLPKLAAHDQRSVARHAAEVARAVGYREDDVFCAVLPLTGVFSYVPAVAAVAAGATNLLISVFDKAETVRLMHEHSATHTFGGDDLYDGLFRGWQQSPVRLDSWRIAGVASFIGRARQLLPWLAECSTAAMCGVYGSSEVFSLVSIRDRGTRETERHLGGGRLVSDALEVRAVDPGTGEVVEAGVIGSLEFRGYNVLQAYLRGDEQQPPHLDDGWFSSGDLGSVERDGRTFTYEGRAGDALRLRGFLVQPSEIEHFMMEHPAISGVKVVGVEKDGRDEAIAFVTAEPGQEVDVEQLLAWCRAELAPFKVPARVLVIDEMPVTSGTNGSKVRTAELRKLAQQLIVASAS